MKASGLYPQEIYRIDEVAESPIQAQMHELGILEGKSIRLLHKAPFNGPLVFEIGSSKICISIQEAAYIHVSKVFI